MRRSILLTFCSLALVAAAGCGGTSTATLSSNDAAVVGSQSITKDQFQGLMDRAKASYEDGMLVVELPLAQPADPRSVPIEPGRRRRAEEDDES